MADSTRVSDGELGQMRRNIARNPNAYSAATRAKMSVFEDPLEFLATQNVWLKNVMLWDVLKERAIAQRKGEEFNPNSYFHSDPSIYRKSHPKFEVSSRDGYLVGRDFLTNQPIFKKY